MLQHTLFAPSADLIRVHFSVADGVRSSNFSKPVVVGRDSSCDLRLDDRRIDPQHAEIYRVGDLWWVRDLGSADGLFLDDECIQCAPVPGPATLQLGVDGPRIWLDPGRGRADRRDRARGVNPRAGSGVEMQ